MITAALRLTAAEGGGGDGSGGGGGGGGERWEGGRESGRNGGL